VSKDRRRELVREYKEQRPRRGVYAIRCAATGEVWASASPNLEKQQNSIWFQLRMAGFPNRALQAAWNAHGEGAFSFAIVAELSVEERSDYAIKADLKALEAEWRERLGARAAVG
jgi:hypothetical protein